MDVESFSTDPECHRVLLGRTLASALDLGDEGKLQHDRRGQYSSPGRAGQRSVTSRVHSATSGSIEGSRGSNQTR